MTETRLSKPFVVAVVYAKAAEPSKMPIAKTAGKWVVLIFKQGRFNKTAGNRNKKKDDREIIAAQMGSTVPARSMTTKKTPNPNAAPKAGKIPAAKRFLFAIGVFFQGYHHAATDRKQDPKYLNGVQHLTDGETDKHRHQRAQRTDRNDNRYRSDGKPTVKAIKRSNPATATHYRIQEPRVSGKRHASRPHDDDKHTQTRNA